MGFIYLITNATNGKQYVGQTRRTIQLRWDEHKYDATHDSVRACVLHRAMRKYGLENFSIEQIEECDNSLLDEREAYWTQEYKTLENGYNIAPVGKGGRKCADDIVLYWWGQGLSAKEIAEKVPVCRSTVTEQLKCLGITQKEINARATLRSHSRFVFPVYQYNLDGTFVREFSSLKEARNYIGKEIRLHPKRNRTYGGYQWRDYKAEKIEAFTPINNNPIRKGVKGFTREVAQYDLDGNYIQTFKSLKEAGNFIGVNSSSIIGDCNGYRKTSGGYKWQYVS